MKKRKTLTRLLCATVSVATVAAVGGMALADETDVVEVEEPAEIVEEQPDAEEAEAAEEAEVIADETEAEETEAPEEEALEAEEVVEEVEVTEDEVIVEVIADEEALDAEVVVAEEEVITVEEEEIIFEEAEARNGWVHDSDGKWYYYQDGELYTGWLELNGKKYYLDENYWYMHIGPTVIDGDYYFFGTDGAMLTGWVNYDGNWYYLNSDGKAALGWKKIGKNWYYFEKEENLDGPYMYRNDSYRIGTYAYVFDANGVMCTGWTKLTSFSGWDSWYYSDSNGHAVSGWQKIGKKWYYFSPYSNDMLTGLSSIYNESTEEYDYYYFNENGVMQTGWVGYESSGETDWYYFASSGLGAEGWTQINKKWYYFEDARALTGMVTIGSDTYFFGLPTKEDGSANPDVGVMQTGWVRGRVNVAYYSSVDCWYYCKGNGVMVTGWQKINGKWYYFEPFDDGPFDGTMATGFEYLYNEETHHYDIYYFGDNGVMQADKWVKDGNDWLYFDSNGHEVHGWYKINNKWYYFDNNMLVGYHYINGELYNFGTDGVCVNPPANPTNPIELPIHIVPPKG